MAGQSTLRVVANHLGRLFAALEEDLLDDENFAQLAAELGWLASSRPQAYVTLGQQLQTFSDGTLLEILSLADEPTLERVLELFDKIKTLHGTIANLPAPDGGGGVGAGGADVVEHLIARHLASSAPRLYWVLRLLGIITLTFERPAGAARTPFVRTVIDYERPADWVLSPTKFLQDVFGWGGDNFDFPKFAGAVAELLSAFQVRASLEQVDHDLDLRYQTPATRAAARMPMMLELTLASGFIGSQPLDVGLAMLPLPAEGGHKPGVILQPTLSLASGTDLVVENVRFTVAASTDAIYGIAVHPDGVEVRYPFGGTQLPAGGLDLSATVTHSPPVLLFGAPSGTRLELAATTLKGSTRPVATSGTEVRLGVSLEGLTLVLHPGEGDGFVAELLGSKSLTATLDAALVWSSVTGLGFDGGAGLTLDTGAAFDIGPVRIRSLRVSLEARKTSEKPAAVTAALAVNAGASLGPVGVSLSEVGVGLSLGLGGGNAGPYEVDIGFRPPTGAGLSIEAGPVGGAGFLSLDPEQGRYTGALSLRIYEIEVSAFGIIDTKLPGGQSGFSFAIIISARFTPIPLGFGFTLNGVGGMLGINRTVEVQLLRDAVRAHTLDHVLFPEDPQKNALAILNDLGAFFPPAKGRYTFGPMAIIGWGGGTVAILEAELGIILELPDPVRLVLLGQVKVGLPDLKKRFVKLNFDVVGALDFAKKSFSLDASMYDSQVGGFDLSGDMALRLNWGDQPNFVLSIGGFHPLYRAPAGFPPLKRVTVALASNGKPSITISGYMAITSNTFQVGAKAEVLAQKGSFNVYGWIGFDALFVFKPFAFRADFSAGVALRKGTRHWASIHLSGTLSGPNPWHASGEACLSLFFFDICVGFDVDLSKRAPEPITALPPIVDKLVPELQAPRSWSAEPATAAHQVVSLVEGAADPDRPLLDPLGAAVVKQRILPLDFKLDLFEHTKLGKKDPRKFRVKTITLEGPHGRALPGTPPSVKDFFARGQFQALTDAAKLALPGFELMNAGTKVGSDSLVAGEAVGGTTDYETLIIDGPDIDRDDEDPYTPDATLTERLAARSAQLLGGLQAHGPEKFSRGVGTLVKTSLGGERYTIATIAGLQPRNDLVDATEQHLGFVSKGAARDILAAHLAANPDDRGTLQVVPRLELPNAA